MTAHNNVTVAEIVSEIWAFKVHVYSLNVCHRWAFGYMMQWSDLF